MRGLIYHSDKARLLMKTKKYQCLGQNLLGLRFFDEAFNCDTEFKIKLNTSWNSFAALKFGLTFC